MPTGYCCHHLSLLQPYKNCGKPFDRYLQKILPEKFKLEFSTEDEAKTERPVMIHRFILGSVERMFAILLEHCRGLTLAPLVVKIDPNVNVI
ncbi:hypothetical protein RYX36_004306 [Vicia faba]